MDHDNTAHVEVELKATRVCYLSHEPRFDLVLLLTLRNSEEPCIFLKGGFPGVENLHSINSAEVVQCFEDVSSEHLQILRQDVPPSFLRLEPNRSGYVTFTTCNNPKPYELPFETSSLQAGKMYRLCFKPAISITHWSPGNTTNLQASPQDFPSPPTLEQLSPWSAEQVPWRVIGGSGTLVFEARHGPPKTPNVRISMSAPATFSRSRNPPFTFTINFSTDSPKSFSVLAQRHHVRATDSDIEIIDPNSGSRLGPVKIDAGDDDGTWNREDFLAINGTYSETRVLDPANPLWEDLGTLNIGDEYFLRSLGGKWSWWSEDSIDEIVASAEARNTLIVNLGSVEGIEYTGGSDWKFRVVE